MHGKCWNTSALHSTTCWIFVPIPNIKRRNGLKDIGLLVNRRNPPRHRTHSVAEIHKDLKAFDKLLEDPKTDLTAKIPWGDGQTILREILLAGDHTSYHVGQLIMLRKQLGAWKD